MKTSLIVVAALFVGLSTEISIRSRIQARGSKFTIPTASDDVEKSFQNFLTQYGKNIKDIAQYSKKLLRFRN